MSSTVDLLSIPFKLDEVFLGLVADLMESTLEIFLSDIMDFLDPRPSETRVFFLYF